MKAISKRVLSLGLSLAMVASVIAVPSTEAQAATGIAKSKTYYAGQTKTLKLTTSSSWKSVKTTWSTSKKSIVKIAKKTNKTVTINCVKAGKANVTAKVSFKKGTKKYTKKYTCKVTVKNPTFEVSAGQTTLKLGETTAIKVSKSPASAVVKYSSDDAAIAKISGGKITATGIGTTNINARMKIGDQTVARKSIAITVLPSEDGITATLSNPFTADYPNTVLVNQNAIINVACVKDGKPVSGEVVVLTLGKGADAYGNYEVKGSTTATTNSKGIAAFVIGNVNPNLKASASSQVASVNYSISVPGSTTVQNGSVDFAAVTYSKVNILNNDATNDAYPNLVPGTNYTGVDGQAETASMDEPTNHTDEYVESQQVSSADKDEHAVYVGGGYPEITFPGAASDLSAANKKVDTINVAYGPYDTYETHSDYITLTEDPNKLTYATLNFDYLKLSKYTHVRIATYASEQDAKNDTSNTGGKNPQEYVGAQNQGAFAYQIPLEAGAKCVKVTVFSAGQVDTAMNAGYKASSIEYVFKTGTTKNSYAVKGADVTWNIVDTQYTAEVAVPASLKNADGTYTNAEIALKTGETLTYKMPRFPYTGTAVLTHYDANGKVVAYYAYATVNNGVNQNVLGQDDGRIWTYDANGKATNPMSDNLQGACYKITSDELRDKVGTIVSQDGSIAKVNSYQSGRTTLEGKVTVNGKVVEALDAETNTMYTSIQWNPIPNATVATDAFVAFVGQNIEVVAQLIDKNGNAVTQANQIVTFYYTENGTKKNVATTTSSITSKTGIPAVSVVKVETKTDSKGQAKLILKASDITGVAKVTADADAASYDAKLMVASKAVESADLYWVEAELAFKDKTVGGTEYTTTPYTTTATVSGNVIEPLSGSTWLYGVYSKANALANVGDLAGKPVKIDGLNISMAKAASGVGTVETTTKSGQVKAASTKTGKTTIVSKIDSSSVTSSTSVSVDGASATFAGTGTASISRTLKLEVNWKNNGMTAELLAPNGRVVSGNTAVYAKVTDTNGNPVKNQKVTFKTDDDSATLDNTSVNTNQYGVAKVDLTLGDNSKVTVTATVDGISDQTYTMTYIKQSATAPAFGIDKNQDDVTEKYKAVFDKDAKTITLVFTDDVVESSVIVDGITAKYATTDMGVDSVTVNGNIVVIKVVNVPGTISADTAITVKFETKPVKGISYTMTSVNGVQYEKTVTFMPDAGKTVPREA